MSTGLNKTLIDKEKVIINGREAFRLFFFDEQTGFIIKVISYVATKDVYLAQPDSAQPSDSNMSDITNALR